jgi:hypothetical protein
MSNILAAIYNSRGFIARMEGVSEAEILALHQELRDKAESLKGTWRLINVIGHRPAKTEEMLASDTIIQSTPPPQVLMPAEIAAVPASPQVTAAPSESVAAPIEPPPAVVTPVTPPAAATPIPPEAPTSDRATTPPGSEPPIPPTPTSTP